MKGARIAMSIRPFVATLLIVAAAAVTGGIAGVQAGPPDAKAEAHLRRGDEEFRLRRYDAARVAYREAQAAAPGSASPLRKEALCLIKTGDVKAALALLDRAVTLEPGNVSCLNTRAVALLRCLRPEEAVGPALKATHLQPENASLWDTLGQVYAACGQMEAARAAFGRALKLEPRHESARSGLAGVPEP